jgi:hypothetical protein
MGGGAKAQSVRSAAKNRRWSVDRVFGHYALTGINDGQVPQEARVKATPATQPFAVLMIWCRN